MKTAFKIVLFVVCAGMLTCCHSNPHNTFGGPLNHPKDTAAKKRDTSSTDTRTH